MTPELGYAPTVVAHRARDLRPGARHRPEVRARIPLPRAAVKSWERFLTLVPKGEDHDRVVALVETARSKEQTR